MIPGTMFGPTEQHRALLVGNTTGGGGAAQCHFTAEIIET